MFTNDLQIFSNEEFGQIRTLVIDGEPWFVGKDVAVVLGYGNPRDALYKHVDEEDKGVAKCDTLGGNQNLTIINESGIYALVFSSKLPSARKFKHWVTSEVLPTLRRHKIYASDDTIENILNNPDFGIKLLTELKEERQRRKDAEKTIKEQKPLVDFANQVSNSNNLISMNEMAKLLREKDIPIGRNGLFEWLRNKGILMQDNVPYQEYINRGYFKVNEYVHKVAGGKYKVTPVTYVTGKGQLFISNKLKKEYNIA
ncbi:MAG: phage antirepressor [Elusimicrobiales bacterium]|nr:phage antirepressor [Elusimicrobiales bacterium]